ncbi:MAG: hypothetical protein GF331_17545 [Chitinivibrionales bacterium]|nr:hypothetical protein [Chitinivibrionales bacterium]
MHQRESRMNTVSMTDLKSVAAKLLPGEFTPQLKLTWRRAPVAPIDPLQAEPRDIWPLWRADDSHRAEPGEPIWVYTDLVWPEQYAGVDLAGTEGRVFIWGYSPFTLYIDGVEQWAEEHVWHATSGIADPLPVPIEPGRRHRLVLKVEPTALPVATALADVVIQYQACHDIGIELAALHAQLTMARMLGFDELADTALTCLDARDLAAYRWPRVLEQCRRAERILDKERAAAKALRVHLVGHAHIDMDWMWTWPDTVHCVRRDFTAVAQLLDDHPEVCFTASQAPCYQVSKDYDPPVFEAVRRHVTNGRWEVAAGTWVEGDLAMADGETLVRQITLAHDWCQRELGTASRVFWAPDTFSHPPNMPQIARLGQMDHYFHWRCNPTAQGEEAGCQVRTWRGCDGTDMLTLSNGYTATLHPGTLVGALREAIRNGRDTAFCVWGLGDHGGGLPRRWLDLMSRIRERPLMPTLVFSGVNAVADALRSQAGAVQDSEAAPLFEGCFTSHAELKAANRHAEQALLAAEQALALAGRDTECLRAAWQDVCYNQFHDIMCGCCVPGSAADALTRFATAIAQAERQRRDALEAASEESPGSVMVHDPVGQPRRDIVRLPQMPGEGLYDEAGSAVPCQAWDNGAYALLECTGAALRNLRPGPLTESQAPAVTTELGCYRIETPLAVVHLHRESGVVVGYHDKQSDRQMVAYGLPKPISHFGHARRDLCLGMFQLIEEEPVASNSAWIIGSTRAERNLLNAEECSLIDTGPLAARFRVVYRVNASTIRAELIVWRDVPRLEWVLRIDWQEQAPLGAGLPQLKMAFTAALRETRARFHTPFAVVERPADGQEQAAQHWAGLCGRDGGFAVLNDGRYGYDALGARLRLTLLRTANHPDPRSDRGSYDVRVAWVPHDAAHDAADLALQALAFNRPLLAVAGRRGTRELPAVECTRCVITSRSRDSSGALVLRVCAIGGEEGEVVVRHDGQVEEIDFLGKPLAEHKRRDGTMWRRPVRPYEICTLRCS